MPPLPKEEAKIIVRPRGGLCVSKVGPTAVADAIWQAAGLDSATRDTDTMCPNFQQNIMVISTPNRNNAARYVGISGISVADRRFEVSAYEAAPHSTCKGVIRGISLSDGPVMIDKKLVNPETPRCSAPKESRTPAPWWFCSTVTRCPILSRTAALSSSALYFASKWTCVTAAADSGTAPTSALRPTKPSAGDAEKQTPTLSIGAIPNASSAEATTLRPPRSVNKNSRCRISSGADGGNAPAPSTTRIKPGKHRLNADLAAAAPGPGRDPGLVDAPGAAPSPGPGRDPGSDTNLGPDPVPGAAKVPEPSHHPDLSPPPQAAGGNRPSFGPIWCVPSPAPIRGPLRHLVTTRPQSKLGTRKSFAYAKRTTTSRTRSIGSLKKWRRSRNLFRMRRVTMRQSGPPRLQSQLR